MRRVPRLLYLVTEDWFFHSHFLPMARAARDDGFEVVVAARYGMHRAAIEREGFRVRPMSWRRSGGSPLGAAREFVTVVGLLRQERPDIVHCIALKPVILGGLAAKLAGRPLTVCAVTGLGRTWVPGGIGRRALRILIRSTLRWIARSGRVRILVENRDHGQAFAASGVVSPDRIVRVPGAGVDLGRYRPLERGEGAPEPVAALVARMIPIKGVEIAVEAVRRLAERGTGVRLLLVGAPDSGHRGAITEAALRGWSRHPSIEWLGRQEDVGTVWGDADIAVLPSLGGDGLPKSLLEAAACGKPIVTTDTDGCREVVLDGVNGFLVPPGDAPALADAIERLARDPALRRAMGRESRRLAERSFDEKIVAGVVSDLYRTMLREAGDRAHGSLEAAKP